jgi:hypothetical protein
LVQQATLKCSYVLVGERIVGGKETLKMSRGLGKVQIGLLAIIERIEKPLNTYRLARLFYQPHVEGHCLLTPTQVKATYRALCSLERRGKIVSHGHKGNEYGGGGGFVWWSRLGEKCVTADKKRLMHIAMRAAE